MLPRARPRSLSTSSAPSAVEPSGRKGQHSPRAPPAVKKLHSRGLFLLRSCASGGLSSFFSAALQWFRCQALGGRRGCKSAALLVIILRSCFQLKAGVLNFWRLSTAIFFCSLGALKPLRYSFEPCSPLKGGQAQVWRYSFEPCSPLTAKLLS